MIESEKIVITEPTTRPNRSEDILEADSVWLYRERPIRLYPTGEADEMASPRLSKARLATILGEVEKLGNEPGVEVIFRSPTDGFVLIRRIQLGWLVACARPDAGQFEVAAELTRYANLVSEQFASNRFDGDESTDLLRSGKSGRQPTWGDVADDLSDRLAGTTGRLRMFALREWRRLAPTFPLDLNLSGECIAHREEEIPRGDLIALQSTFETWVERLADSVDDLPTRISMEPTWSLRKEQARQ